MKPLFAMCIPFPMTKEGSHTWLPSHMSPITHLEAQLWLTWAQAKLAVPPHMTPVTKPPPLLLSTLPTQDTDRHSKWPGRSHRFWTTGTCLVIQSLRFSWEGQTSTRQKYSSGAILKSGLCIARQHWVTISHSPVTQRVPGPKILLHAETQSRECLVLIWWIANQKEKNP